MATKDINLHLKAVRGEGTITLHARNGEKLFFLGASVESSVNPGYHDVAPITFVAPPEKGTGLIAVSVKSDKACYPFFLKIGWQVDKPHIFIQEKDEPWVPPSDKLAQITNSGRALAVKIDGEWYTTEMHVENFYSLPKEVGNLICQYLISDDESLGELAEQIKQKASELFKFQSLKKIAETNLEVCRATLKKIRKRLERAGNKKKTIQDITEILSSIRYYPYP